MSTKHTGADATIVLQHSDPRESIATFECVSPCCFVRVSSRMAPYSHKFDIDDALLARALGVANRCAFPAYGCLRPLVWGPAPATHEGTWFVRARMDYDNEPGTMFGDSRMLRHMVFYRSREKLWMVSVEVHYFGNNHDEFAMFMDETIGTIEIHTRAIGEP